MLRRIAHRAAGVFTEYGYPSLAAEPEDTPEVFSAFVAGRHVRVATAGAAPVGFAVAAPLGTHFHLHELSVDPAHGRRGVGGALVRAVVDHARTQGFEDVSLSTFRWLPFNAPFYATHGFAALDLDVAPPELRETFLSEVPSGIAPADRVLMVKPLIRKA